MAPTRIISGLPAAAVSMITETNRVQRKRRAPVHDHYIEHRPYQIQPFMIAPVLPGETLKSLNLSGRVITDPIAVGGGNIIPWWCEHYYFYVKARQLPLRDDFEAAMLEGTDMGNTSAAEAATYHNEGINFVQMALRFVVENGGFRDDGEAWDVGSLDGLPLAAAVAHGKNWADSLMADATLTTPSDLQVPSHNLELAKYAEQYERMREMNLVDMDFEDWLSTFGVNVPDPTVMDRPELIRRISNWTYPTNTIDPATGTPTGAVSWAINERADKDRFFMEPGFIIGITVVKPKIYMGNQAGNASTMMDTALSWMPRMLADQPHASLREFAGGAQPGATGPLKNQTAGYWVDLRDLFLYGDQFLVGASAGGYAPALPLASGEKRFMDSTMINALFHSPTVNKVRQEGVTRLSILGHPTTATDNT